eukprot:236995-Pelagomonas_calceolata.AAC.1
MLRGLGHAHALVKHHAKIFQRLLMGQWHPPPIQNTGRSDPEELNFTTSDLAVLMIKCFLWCVKCVSQKSWNKVQKACDTHGAKNKLIHQCSEKEHVLDLEFDCKNTCHTQRFHHAKQPIQLPEYEHEAGTCSHYT